MADTGGPRSEPAALSDPTRLADAYRTLLEQLSESTLSGRFQALSLRDATILGLRRELARVKRDLAHSERRLRRITNSAPYRALTALRRLRPQPPSADQKAPEPPSRSEAPVVSSREAAPPPGAGHILVADEHVPTYDRDSGSQRMFRLLQILVEGGRRVTFVPVDFTQHEKYSAALAGIGVEIWDDGRLIIDQLREAGSTISVALLSRPPVALTMLPLIRRYAPRAAIAFDTVDLHFVREGRRFSVDGSDVARESAERHEALETALATLSDAVVTTTEDERAVVQHVVPGARTYVIPNIHEVREDTAPFGDRRDVVFVGNTAHQPNRDALTYLAHEIWPLVRARVDGARLLLVGYDPKDALAGLAAPDVSLVGWVEDLDAFLQKPRVFAAPLRFGAGMKGKIGQALAVGLPVVTTPIGAEGMNLTDGREALITDQAGAFADAVVRLYQDEALWREIARRGKEHVRTHFTPTVVGRAVEAMLTDLAAAPASSRTARG